MASPSEADVKMADQAQKLGLLLPKSLILKTSPKGYQGLGVFVLKKVKAGVVYGPYKGQLIQKEALMPDMDTTRMWEVLRNGGFGCFIDGYDGSKHNNWLKFVRCAKNQEEQNVEVFQIGVEIYFRATRPLNVMEELIAWYSEKFAQNLEIVGDDGEQLMEEDEKGENFSCTTCKRAFSYEDFAEQYILTPEDHSPLVPWGCLSCQKTLTSLYNISKHLKLKEKYKNYFNATPSGDGRFLFNQKLKMYSCPHCSATSRSLRYIRRHSILHTLPRNFHCGICKKNFRHNWLLVSHSIKHKPDLFKCSTCKKKFFEKAILEKHLEVCNENTMGMTQVGHSQYQCMRCQKKFRRQYSLRRHIRTHQGEESIFKCKVCKKEFRNRSALTKHSRTHRKKAPVIKRKDTVTNANEPSNDSPPSPEETPTSEPMDMSEQEMETPIAVLRSDSSRSGRQKGKKSDALEVIEIAEDKSWSDDNDTDVDDDDDNDADWDADLDSDMISMRTRSSRQVTGSRDQTPASEKEETSTASTKRRKDHECTLCKLNFNEEKLYNSHIHDIHSVKISERRSKCKTCSKMFNTKSNLVRHFKRVHSSKEKRFDCKQCKKSFHDNWSLSRHIAKKHAKSSNTNRCAKCFQKFKNKTILDYHSCNVDYGVCQLCKDAVLNHLTEPTDQAPTQFKCCKCGSTLASHGNLKQHAWIHSSERYQCFHCSITFPQQWILDRHLKNVHKTAS